MREKLLNATKDAMRSGDKPRLSTLRMMSAAIKDRDIAARVGADGKPSGVEKVDDSELLQLLQKMVKQRRESIATYESAGRNDLVASETAEIAVIEEFLPQQMDEDAIAAAVQEAISEVGAAGPKDMGKVMGALKQRYTGQMDFSKASAKAKGALSG